MKENIQIAPVRNNHSAAIIDLILPIQQLEFNVPVTLADQPDLQQVEDFYYRNGGHFWGAFQNNDLIGTIALINIGHNSGAIRKMFVKKEFRGKEFGIAQQLLETLITYSNANGIDDLYLGTVGVLKAAQRFYERNGFDLIVQEELPDYFPRMPADHIFYHRSL
jgi:GNAT superfamily N-acetyltransferase